MNREIVERLLKFKNEYQDAEAQRQYQLWIDALTELESWAGWQKSEQTKKLAEIAEKRILDIEKLLATNENLNNEDRLKLFAEKKVHRIYLDLMTQDVDEEIEAIEDEIREESRA